MPVQSNSLPTRSLLLVVGLVHAVALEAPLARVEPVAHERVRRHGRPVLARRVPPDRALRVVAF